MSWLTCWTVDPAAGGSDPGGGEALRARRDSASGGGAGIRAGVVGSVAVGDVAAVRPSDQCLFREAARHPRQWLWAVVLAASVGDRYRRKLTAGASRAGFELWIWVIAIMGPALLLCVAGSPGLCGQARCRCAPRPGRRIALGTFRGPDQGVVGRLSDGIEAMLTTPELYVWAAVAVTATAWQQSSFRAGSLAASLPAMTIAEPVVASVLASSCLARRCVRGFGLDCVGRRGDRDGGGHRRSGAGRSRFGVEAQSAVVPGS